MMKIIALIVLRALSIFAGVMSIAFAVTLGLGVYAVATSSMYYREASASALGAVHGGFIFAPAVGTAMFGIAAYMLWRFSSRFKLLPSQNAQVNPAPDQSSPSLN